MTGAGRRIARVDVPESGTGAAAAEALHRVFGYSSFRGQQQEIIEHVCAGGDAVALMPTGSGKSLCYQIPALVRDGTGVVISPLIALMQDQVDALTMLGVQRGWRVAERPGRGGRLLGPELGRPLPGRPLPSCACRRAAFLPRYGRPRCAPATPRRLSASPTLY